MYGIVTRVIVIGAGWSGIAAAVKYLQIKPSVDLLILDEDSSFGGTWSAARIYPHLVADSPRGMLEYSDMTMVDEAHPEWSTISGQDVHNYLDKYAAKYDLHRRTKFNTRVQNARRSPQGGWEISTSEGEVYHCDKLIVAYGQTSEPNIPDIPNEGFAGFTMHSKTLAQEMQRLEDPAVNHVTVLGAQKSAAECCIAALGAGKKVHWVIRDSGSGPPELVYRDDEELKKLGKIIFSKLVAQFTPSIYNRQGFWYQLLHSGRWPFGRFLINNVLEKIPLPAPDYNANANMQKLKPRYSSFFWETTGLVLLLEDSILFRELLRGENLIVHRGDPTNLAAGAMHLATGETVPTDMLIYATGWDPVASSSIFSLADRVDLGLPVPLTSVPASEATHRSQLSAQARAEISRLFPLLSRPPQLPSHPLPPHAYTPARLLRHIVSAAVFARRDRSIGLVGFSTTVHTGVQAELYALWAVAWMEGLHPPRSPLYRLSRAALEHEQALESAWNMARYPFTAPRGSLGFSTEIVTFWDQVMRDLGLTVDRQNLVQQQQGTRRSWWSWRPFSWWWREWIHPYTSGCYRGCVEELLENARAWKREEEGMGEVGEDMESKKGR